MSVIPATLSMAVTGTTSPDALQDELERYLTRTYGVMLSSAALAKELGYPSAGAYRNALARHAVPVPVFQVPKRKGRFALARDVARWLVEQRQSATFPPGCQDKPPAP